VPGIVKLVIAEEDTKWQAYFVHSIRKFEGGGPNARYAGGKLVVVVTRVVVFMSSISNLTQHNALYIMFIWIGPTISHYPHPFRPVFPRI
jgi:hypothetical protein